MPTIDPIADMLTRIRNAQRSSHTTVRVAKSKVTLEIARILKNEGFIEGYVEVDGYNVDGLKVFLRYTDTGGSIRGLRRVSKPSRRIYVGKGDLPRVRNGLGISIITTSQGVMTDFQARRAGVGGEVLCQVW